MKIYIWGTGFLASDYLEKNEVKDSDIQGFIESKRSKPTFRNKMVYEPREIRGKEYDCILVCVGYFGREILELCMENGLDTEKVILMDNWEWVNGSPMENLPETCCRKILENGFDVKETFPVLYKTYIKERDIQASRYMIVSKNGYDMVETDALISRKDFRGKDYGMDYFRYRTFELFANEILKEEIPGAAAELGVCKGVFARLINAKLKDRTIYLFDTFDSFDEGEFRKEYEQGRIPEYFYEALKLGGNEEKALAVMPYRDKCIVRKGLFPETAKGLEDVIYAFVSLDVDLEDSTLEGLRYFYPRLSSGGAIFLHDYNNRFLEGVKCAVASYEKETGSLLKKIPLADEGGTVVIVK